MFARVKLFQPSLSLALLATLLAILPLGALVYQAASLAADDWASLWTNKLPGLLINTVLLAVCVGLLSGVLGLAAAWLTSRYEYRGRKTLSVLLALPLAIPGFVFAAIYTRFDFLPPLENFTGATILLSLAGYPYVYLLARLAIQRLPGNMEDAAASLGCSRATRFRRVVWPLLRPAVLAGVIIVMLHVVADYGTVSLLRVETFTKAIHVKLDVAGEFPKAAALGAVVVLISLLLLKLERVVRRKDSLANAQPQHVNQFRLTGKSRVALVGFAAPVLTLALLVPLGWMLYWTAMTWGVVSQAGESFVDIALYTAAIAAVAAMVAILLALPVTYYHWRNSSHGRNRVGGALMQGASVGFSLPGPVVALCIMVLAIMWDDLIDVWVPEADYELAQSLYLSGTFMVLVIALALRYLITALQAQDTGFKHIHHNQRDAAKSMGAGALKLWCVVVLPRLLPAFAMGFLMVFVEVMKDLPIAMVMRPIGFEPLSMKIWAEAGDEQLEMAARASLLLVLVSTPVLAFTLRRFR